MHEHSQVFDKNNDGHISAAELKHVMSRFWLSEKNRIKRHDMREYLDCGCLLLAIRFPAVSPNLYST